MYIYIYISLSSVHHLHWPRGVCPAHPATRRPDIPVDQKNLSDDLLEK